MKQQNEVYRISEKETLSYLNYFHMLDEINFDFSSDLADWSHVNYSGMRKITSHLGQYLVSNYDLSDHRGETEYAFMDEYYEQYTKEVDGLMLKTKNNHNEFAEAIRGNDNYVYTISAYNSGGLQKTRINDFLKTLGLETEFAEDDKYFAAIVNGDNVCFKQKSDAEINRYVMQEDVCFAVGSEGTIAANKVNDITVGARSYGKKNSGVNVVVYSKFTGEVVDSINISLSDMKLSR